MLSRDCFEHLWRHMLGDQSRQWLVAGHAIAGQSDHDISPAREITRTRTSRDGAHDVVEFRPKKRKWSDQCAGTDSGDCLELGPVTACRPACKQSRGEGALIATSRNCQDVCGWQWI